MHFVIIYFTDSEFSFPASCFLLSATACGDPCSSPDRALSHSSYVCSTRGCVVHLPSKSRMQWAPCMYVLLYWYMYFYGMDFQIWNYWVITILDTEDITFLLLIAFIRLSSKMLSACLCPEQCVAEPFPLSMVTFPCTDIPYCFCLSVILDKLSSVPRLFKYSPLFSDRTFVLLFLYT